MNIKLIPDEPRFIHSGDTTVAINKYVLTVNSDLVDFFEVSAKTTRRGDDKMDQKLGEMIAQSKVHLKALKHAKRYLKKTAEELMDECQSVADKLVQYEIAESKEYMHLDDLESGKIVKK